MPTELNTFFYPKSVAVIGASRNPEKLGSIILKNIVDSGFSGTVFPVNPKAEDIQGLKSYSDVASLPEVPELAVIAIPVDFVNEVVEQLGIKGTRNVVVISAGYKEIGLKGATLEKELSSIALKHEINLLGPNCLGFINNYVPINATFAEGVKEVGNLRFLSQSGAIAAAMFDYFASTGLGISEFVTLGNKAGLTENEILEYFHTQTSNTLFNHKPDDLSDLSPIGMYLESISHGKSLAKIISEITKTDPVLIIKPGKTEAAAKAMQSHTGSIAGEDAVLDAVLKSAGAIRCDTLEEFFDYSRAFSWNNLPEGSGVTVISNAGGPAVITSDAIVNSGLQMTVLSETTKQNIKENLPESASVNNPVDVLGDALADRFKMAIEKSLSAEETNMLLVLLTPQLMTQPKETAQNIAELSRKYNKPVFASFIGGEGVAESIKILNKNKISAYSYPEAAVKAMSVMWNFKKHQNSKKEQKDIEHIEVNPEMGSIRNVLQHAINEKQKTLDNQSVAHIFESCGIKTVPSKHAENIQDAISFAEEVSWPVVLKMSAPGLLHKKNIGGVEINIQNTNQLTGAWNSLTEKVNNLDPETRKNMSIEIQKQIIGGTEVIMGTRTDQTFGKIILFGTGGNYSQIVEDRNIHLLPINLNEAKELVANSKIYKLLQSYGEPTLNRLAEMLVRLGTISTMIPEASDIEINPVIVTEDAIWPVDGKIVLNEIERKPMPPTLIEAKCTKHEILADYFHYYEIETPEKFDFKPGQYIP